MQAFEAALATLFADPNIARDAIWRASGVGVGIAVRAVTKRPDQLVGFGASRAVVPTVLIDLRVTEVALPAIGDTVTIGSTIYTIIAEPVGDDLGIVWTCQASL